LDTVRERVAAKEKEKPRNSNRQLPDILRR